MARFSALLIFLCSYPFFPDEFPVRFNLSIEKSKCFNVSILSDGSSLEVVLSLDSNRTQYGIDFVKSRARIFISSVDDSFTGEINNNRKFTYVLLQLEKTLC